MLSLAYWRVPQRRTEANGFMAEPKVQGVFWLVIQYPRLPAKSLVFFRPHVEISSKNHFQTVRVQVKYSCNSSQFGLTPAQAHFAR